MTPIDLLRKGHVLHALAALQNALAKSPAVSVDYLLFRSHLLRKLGALRAAETDVKHALALNPLDVNALEMGTLIFPDQAHALALRGLESPMLSSADRQRLASGIDTSKLPLLIQAETNDALRITVFAQEDQPFALAGAASDEAEPVFTVTPDHDDAVTVSEYTFARHATDTRNVALSIGTSWQTHVSVPPRTPSTADLRQQPPAALLGSAEPWILIPVHNGGQSVALCLNSVAAALTQCPAARVILVDDQSDDPVTQSILAAFAERPGFHLVKTEKNLGFVGAVNTGLGYLGEGPVLLLNSDTYLPQHTLSRLLSHLQAEGVGTVTPFSNNGGMFSLPEPRDISVMPTPDQSERLSDVAFEVNEGQARPVLNANGFAMLISEPCLRDLPWLSEEYVGGYYEEVDYSLRASARGYLHVCATDCFVAHEGAQSFGTRKDVLAAENRLRLLQAFPDYSERFAAYLGSDPLADRRDALLSAANVTFEEVEDSSLPPVGAFRANRDQAPVLVPVESPAEIIDAFPFMPDIACVSQAGLSAHRLQLDCGHTYQLRAVEGGDGALALSLHDENGAEVLAVEAVISDEDTGPLQQFGAECARICRRSMGAN